MSNRLDVVSLGSTMLRLSVAAGTRLAHAAAYTVTTAGSESNTMAALAAMGGKTAWVSRLTRNFIGERIRNDLRGCGVDTSGIIWTDEARNELFFVEEGASPRAGQVVYDRKNSALAAIAEDELDFDFLLSGRFLHLTGITPALSPACVEACRKLKAEAQCRRVPVTFDVNYRAKLWTPEEARAILTPLAEHAALLLLTKDDAERIWRITGSDEEMVTACRERFKADCCVLTLGGDGAIAVDGGGRWRTAGYPVRTIDRLGAGDAFSAGVLAGLLEGSTEQGLRYGAAMAAIKMGIAGDYFRSSREEVLQVMRGGAMDIRR